MKASGWWGSREAWPFCWIPLPNPDRVFGKPTYRYEILCKMIIRVISCCTFICFQAKFFEKEISAIIEMIILVRQKFASLALWLHVGSCKEPNFLKRNQCHHRRDKKECAKFSPLQRALVPSLAIWRRILEMEIEKRDDFTKIPRSMSRAPRKPPRRQ